MKDLNVTYIQFGYVYEISDGDEEFIRDLFCTFLQKIPEDLTKIDNAFEQNKWDEVGKTAHKMRSSALFLGANQLGEAAASLELYCLDKTIKQEKIQKTILLLKTNCEQVVKEITLWLTNKS